MSIANVVESLLRAKHEPTWENVVSTCHRNGIKPPSSRQSLSSLISTTRKNLGLPPRRGGNVAIINAVVDSQPQETFAETTIEESTLNQSAEEVVLMQDDMSDDDSSCIVGLPPPKRRDANANAIRFDPASFVPELEYFWLDGKERVIERIQKISESGQCLTVLVTGPEDSGKTTLPEHFAAKYRRSFFNFNCANIESLDKLFLYRSIDEAFRPKHFESLFLKALRTPNSVINLDDINFLSEKMVRAILSLFDGKKKLYIEEMGRHVEVASGVVLFCTDSCHPKDVSPLFNVCDETVFLDEPQGEDLINLIFAKTGVKVDEIKELPSDWDSLNLSMKIKMLKSKVIRSS